MESFSNSLYLSVITVGEEGTLVFPCWQFTNRAEDYLRSGKAFDVRRSPSALGMLTEMARCYPGARPASTIPTPLSPMVKMKMQLLVCITQTYTLTERKSAYYLAMQMDGIIAGFGVNANCMSFVFLTYF